MYKRGESPSDERRESFRREAASCSSNSRHDSEFDSFTYGIIKRGGGGGGGGYISLRYRHDADVWREKANVILSVTKRQACFKYVQRNRDEARGRRRRVCKKLA